MHKKRSHADADVLHADTSLHARVLSDRYSYAVAMSTLGAFNLAAALVFLTSPSGRRKESLAMEHSMRPHAQSGDSQLDKPAAEP